MISVEGPESRVQGQKHGLPSVQRCFLPALDPRPSSLGSSGFGFAGLGNSTVTNRRTHRYYYVLQAFPLNFGTRYVILHIMTGQNMSETDTPLRDRRIRRLRGIFFIAALGCLVTAVLYLSQGTALRDHEIALPEHVSQKDYQAALRQYQKMYGQEPSHVEVLEVRDIRAGNPAPTDPAATPDAVCLARVPIG